MQSQLDAQAVSILNNNDRGGFTIPTARLYPYQWNWDSAFIALGLATIDRQRAWRELTMLIDGQTADGMIPSILFRNDNPDYFPGPSVWQTTASSLPTTGISQPPVLASMILTLVRRDQAEGLGQARLLFDAVLNWHRWYHRCRTPVGCPVVCTVHPWETGRDNSPDWALGLSSMQIDPDIGPYQRKDIEHADPSQRPSQEEYDKYLTIVKFGRDHNWDQATLTNQGPFLMADPGIHFILLRADRDLLELATLLHRFDAVPEIETWIETAIAGTDYLWNDRLKAFCARDVRSGQFANGFSNASPLCFYAGVGSEGQQRQTLDHLKRIRGLTKFGHPSWDPQAPRFDSQRYWCGPIWPQMNYLIATGLNEQGETELAARLRLDLRQLIELSGFYECFDPLTGSGCIGRDFSWTAALWLAWASPAAGAFEAVSGEDEGFAS
ncbi:MAG: hypothetical protein ETSY1_02705 [Candidatus Entotheonella factor]|uniref:Mannosylglycerate hydrolase MGH1-like glycoside hydrolase domain-containing protein n=1 Tax=Entotheonella factor TaxID=1429438 RepID=W4LZ66_ENTF1|nr:MAG: hypothetical protein ETSY1_02705 [Candidatus Entotheonella factor]